MKKLTHCQQKPLIEINDSEIKKIPAGVMEANMFLKGFNTAKEVSPHAYAMKTRDAKDYINKDLFVVFNDYKNPIAGAAILDDGLIASIFKHPYYKIEGGFLNKLIPQLVGSGGNHLVCAGDVLGETYLEHGFLPVAKSHFKNDGTESYSELSKTEKTNLMKYYFIYPNQQEKPSVVEPYILDFVPQFENYQQSELFMKQIKQIVKNSNMDYAALKENIKNNTLCELVVKSILKDKQIEDENIKDKFISLAQKSPLVYNKQ